MEDDRRLKKWDAKKSNLRFVVLIYRRGKEEAKRENRAGFFILVALTFVNVPGVSRIAVKVKSKKYDKLKVIVLDVVE